MRWNIWANYNDQTEEGDLKWWWWKVRESRQLFNFRKPGIVYNSPKIQGTNVSHLGKRKIMFKSTFKRGYVNSQEGNFYIPQKCHNSGLGLLRILPRWMWKNGKVGGQEIQFAYFARREQARQLVEGKGAICEVQVGLAMFLFCWKDMLHLSNNNNRTRKPNGFWGTSRLRCTPPGFEVMWGPMIFQQRMTRFSLLNEE